MFPHFPEAERSPRNTCLPFKESVLSDFCIFIYQLTRPVAEVVLGRIDKELHSFVIETLTEPKLSAPQRRTMLLKKGLRKSAIDELEVLDGKGKERSAVRDYYFSLTPKQKIG